MTEPIVAAEDAEGAAVAAYFNWVDGPVLASAKLPGSSDWCAPETLDSAGAAGYVDLAMDANGRGLAVWQRMRSGTILIAPYTAVDHCPPAPPANEPAAAGVVAGPPVASPVPTAPSVTIDPVAVVGRGLRSARVTLRCSGGALCQGTLRAGKTSARYAIAAHRHRTLTFGVPARLRATMRHRGRARLLIRAAATSRRVLLRPSRR
jgi:hypothetical protein